MSGYVFPVDPGCPGVVSRRRSLAADPFWGEVPSDIAEELTESWNRNHLAECARCRAYGAANVEVT